MMKFTILKKTAKTFREYQAELREGSRYSNPSNVVFANNGTTTISSGYNYPKKIKGPKQIKSGEEAVYELVKMKERNADTLDLDKSLTKWAFYIDGVPLKNNLKNYIRLKNCLSEKQESSSDFMAIAEIEQKTNAIQDKGIIYAKIEGVKQGETPRITLKFSKWFDGKTLCIEAYRKNPDLKTGKSCVVKTKIEAPPEILDVYWANEFKENINKKIVGYREKVYLCFHTLGLKDTNIRTEIWEDDFGFGDSQIKTKDNYVRISDRFTYKLLELPHKENKTYKVQRGGFEGNDLELYIKLGYNASSFKGYKKAFAKTLKLTTAEKIESAYFAKAVKKDKAVDSTHLPEKSSMPDTHVNGVQETVFMLSETYGVPVEKLKSINNILADGRLVYGRISKLKTDEEILAAQKERDAIYEKRKKAAAKNEAYQPINETTLGKEVHIVVETANLHGAKVNVQLFEKVPVLVEKDKPLPVVYQNKEVTTIEGVTIGENGQAIAKIKLRKKSDNDFKNQKKKFETNTLDQLYLKVFCAGKEKRHKEVFLVGGEMKVALGKILFPFRTMPLNHPDSYKNENYESFNYRGDENNVTTFGYKRNPGNRIHAARDLYFEINEPIYAIYDGIVKKVYSFYYDTWAIEIEHDYEYKIGHQLYVRYGEVSKNDILVSEGDKVERGQQIAKIGKLLPNVLQPYPDKRGMLHIEMYTGEENGNLTDSSVAYSNMLYAVSENYNENRSFKRRKDLFDPLEILDEGLENSKKENLIK